MKKLALATVTAAGLAAIISGCAAPEIKGRDFENKIEPGITKTEFFDGSYKIVREEPYAEFYHHKPGNYDFLRLRNPHMGITDNHCDGIADTVVITNIIGMDDFYFRFSPGMGWLFEKADKLLAEAKNELEIE